MRIASQSNCKKRHVGCIIVNDNGTMMATGYNLHTDGIRDCDEAKTATHAEQMAISDLDGMDLSQEMFAYVTHKPCAKCEEDLRVFVTDIFVKELSPRLDDQFSDDVQVEDKVHPKHYADVDGVPTLRFFESSTTVEGYKGYLQLTAMKYLYRLNSKDDALTNIRKAQFFVNKLEAHIEMDK